MDSRGHNLFREKIRHMCEENLSSFEVDYNILAAECSVLAFFLPEAPTEMLQVRSQIRWFIRIEAGNYAYIWPNSSTQLF